MKNQIREKKGITLIALVITIIVLLILAGVTIATLIGDNGLLQKAASSKQANEKGEIEEQIKLAYNDWKLRKETGETVDLQNTVQTTLDKMYDNVTISKQGKSIIINVKGNEFTLIDDGTIEEGQVACLDIADGNIDLYSNGYKQYLGDLQSINSNNVTEYRGNYMITGKTEEYVVRVCNEGEYNITIKNLEIDVSSKNNLTPFLAGNKSTGLSVTIYIEGNNKLYSKFANALNWSNVTDHSEGSTLELYGSGKLELFSGNSSTCLGGNKAKNITINSGEIYGEKIGENYGSIINGSVTINRWNYNS